MDSASPISQIFERHEKVFYQTRKEVLNDVLRAAELLATALRGGKRIFVCGNGGSAADSQHFAAEFTGHFHKDRKPLPVIALTTDTSALTAIGNDYGFEQVFARQLRALASPGDVLVALTTSGKSKNILEVLRAAQDIGVQSVVLTGMGGTGLRKSATLVIAVPSDETARIQEMHELIYHAWCEHVDSIG